MGHTFPFVKVRFPPLSCTRRRTTLITGGRKLALRWVFTNKSYPYNSYLLLFSPHMFTFPKFTIPRSPNPFFFVLPFLHNLLPFVKMVYKPPVLTTPLNYSSLCLPMCMLIICVYKLFFSLVTPSFLSLIHRPWH